MATIRGSGSAAPLKRSAVPRAVRRRSGHPRIRIRGPIEAAAGRRRPSRGRGPIEASPAPPTRSASSPHPRIRTCATCHEGHNAVGMCRVPRGARRGCEVCDTWDLPHPYREHLPRFCAATVLGSVRISELIPVPSSRPSGACASELTGAVDRRDPGTSAGCRGRRQPQVRPGALRGWRGAGSAGSGVEAVPAGRPGSPGRRCSRPCLVSSARRSAGVSLGSAARRWRR